MCPVVAVRDFPGRKTIVAKFLSQPVTTAIKTPTGITGLQTLLVVEMCKRLLHPFHAFSNSVRHSTSIVTLDFATPYFSLHRTPLHLQVGIRAFPYVFIMLLKENWLLSSDELSSTMFVAYLM